MVRNLNPIERAIRLLVGVMILGLFGVLEPPFKYLALVGLIPLGTALTGHCPVYNALGGKRWVL